MGKGKGEMGKKGREKNLGSRHRPTQMTCDIISLMWQDQMELRQPHQCFLTELTVRTKIRLFGHCKDEKPKKITETKNERPRIYRDKKYIQAYFIIAVIAFF